VELLFPKLIEKYFLLFNIIRMAGGENTENPQAEILF